MKIAEGNFMRKAIISLIVLLISSLCFADTFTERSGGRIFNGYPLLKKKGQLTQVAVENKAPEYIDLTKYSIERNNLGRKNRVFNISIKEPIELISEAQTFEETIKILANQGPLFIVIEIDSKHGNRELSKRVCDAILKIDNCQTIAWISGAKNYGAFNEAAAIALACDKIFISENAYIGALDNNSVNPVVSPLSVEKENNEWKNYVISVAAEKNRPELFVKSFFESGIEIIEVNDVNKITYKQPANKKEKDKAVKIWKSKGELLRLSAADAVTVAIADKIYSSQSRIMADLANTDTRVIPDNKMLKARKRYEQSMADLTPTLNRIRRLQADLDKVRADLIRTSSSIKTINKQILEGAYGNSTQPDRQAGSPYDIERLQTRRETLRVEMLDIANQLTQAYTRAIPLAKKHPDMESIAIGLEKDLKKTQELISNNKTSNSVFR
jgi:hypothetical protein